MGLEAVAAVLTPSLLVLPLFRCCSPAAVSDKAAVFIAREFYLEDRRTTTQMERVDDLLRRA